MSSEIERKETVKAISTGSNFLDRVREQIIQSYTPEKVQLMVEDLCKAEDVKSGREGEFRTPNWRAREKGLETILKIVGMKGENDVSAKAAPTNITIVVNGSVEKKEIIEIKESLKTEGDSKPE